MPIAVAEDGFYLVLVGHYPRAQPTTVHVNPYTAEVMGSLANEERFSNWALNLHSSLLPKMGQKLVQQLL